MIHSRPVVDEANRKAPAFARIFKEMILVTDPDRPFPRAAKGTVLKKQLMTMYEDTIDQLCAPGIRIQLDSG